MPTDTDKPTIKAIAPWFGGKRNLAPRIVAELGEHRSYWEPFCGGLSVVMVKPPCRMETINDLNADIINLARCVADPTIGPKLYRELRRIIFHEDFLKYSADYTNIAPPLNGVPDAQRAMHYFICCWMGISGLIGVEGYKMRLARRYTNKGGHAATRWNGAVASIPAWRRRLRNVAITRMDGFEMIEKIGDEADAAIYCDPPYIEKGSEYLYDFEEADHIRMAELLARFTKARVVVSYYDHPSLTSLYPNWTKISIDVTKATSHQGRRGVQQARATEVLLINGPSYTDAKPEPGLFAERRAD